MKRTYHLWKKNGTGINEEALDTNQDYYIGVNTGNKYNKKEYYISEYKKARIKSIDEINKTGQKNYVTEDLLEQSILIHMVETNSMG